MKTDSPHAASVVKMRINSWQQQTPSFAGSEIRVPFVLLVATSFQNLICLEQAKNSQINQENGEDRERKKAFILSVPAALFFIVTSYSHYY
jgi:hypothetical protein